MVAELFIRVTPYLSRELIINSQNCFIRQVAVHEIYHTLLAIPLYKLHTEILKKFNTNDPDWTAKVK
jgi:hypothetical protein